MLCGRVASDRLGAGVWQASKQQGQLELTAHGVWEASLIIRQGHQVRSDRLGQLHRVHGKQVSAGSGLIHGMSCSLFSLGKY